MAGDGFLLLCFISSGLFNIQINIDRNILSQGGVKGLKHGADLYAAFTRRLLLHTTKIKYVSKPENTRIC